ncbi:MAG TPA: hypothetical protein PKC18_10705 [Lacipirellulaceae bacterium]|nr:hypothetical protein [Lacipirellulaceae bacterium]HMP05695.1 hypothetical protein [Lacipirellulaceae bacterium]
MTDSKLEQRMAELELEVATLRSKIEALAGSKPWWERIAGSFHDDPLYDKAMKLGRQYRQSQKPPGSPPTGR